MEASGRMKVTILGSGTCVPSLERRPCSILVQIGTYHILVDAGPGTMGQLLKTGTQINDLDMILLSHFHLDHCAEVAPLLFALKYSGLERKKDLILAGGDGLHQFYQGLNQVYDQSIDMGDVHFSLMELGPHGRVDPDNGRLPVDIEFTRVIHKNESRAYRFTDSEGFSLVYSGDTDVCDDLVQLAKGADTLICESSFPDELKVSGHLTPCLAGEIAAKAGVKNLVLTHFYPECKGHDLVAECKKTFSGKVVQAQDLMIL